MPPITERWSRVCFSRITGVHPSGLGLDQPRQEVEPRFVLENQHPALAPCPLAEVGPDFGTPALDGRLIALHGPPDRDLRRPAEFFEQPADVILVVAGAELLLDDQGDPGTGPHPAAEAVSLRAMPEELGDEAFLCVGQAG